MRISIKQFSFYVIAFATIASILVGLWARFYHLGQITTPIFDEVYFPVFAKNYLQGISVFDVHPPLGKFIIAGAIAVFGDSPFSWRIMPALFGCGIVFVGAACVWYLLKSRIAILLITLFLASETILIVYSRTGLMDGIHLFFILLSFWTALRAKTKRDVFLVVIAIGLAVSVKWVALGVLLPVAYVLWQKKLLPSLVIGLLFSLLIYISTVYFGQVLNGSQSPFADTLLWHQQAFEYHLHLTATHPWSSVWWTWPFMTRPVLLYNSVDETGHALFMNTIGNPILWWSSTAAFLLSVIEIVRVDIQDRVNLKNHPLIPLLLGYAAFLIPWIPIHRVVFIYHYLPSYAFALMMLAYWLRRSWNTSPIFVALYALVVLGVSWYFLPLVMALPISQSFLQQHFWLSTWL